jgi:D-alanyl-D-alanine carboxypeptidase/D-alanyl-D-alanine-endopeptidase (penicillin-binding protein 4)
MLLLLLGREKAGSGSVAAGLQVLRGFLSLAGIAPEDYALYDGCGLSRHDLASPRTIVKLLRYAARQTWGPEFIDSLPLAGVDGTLASRFHPGTPTAGAPGAPQGMPAEANLRAKTGQLEHVNVLSGYVTNAAGRRLVFSILSNNHTLSGKRADDIIDEIVTEAQRSRN